MSQQYNTYCSESSCLSLRQSSSDNSNLFRCRFPRFPHMRDYNQRIGTFQNWQHHIDCQPADFADAGFFYLGVGDRVKCFYCNGGLQYWKQDEEPWSEHAKWFPNCEYLLCYKGIAFVEDIASRYPGLQRSGLDHQQQRNENQIAPSLRNTSIVSSRPNLSVLPTENLNDQHHLDAANNNRNFAGSSNLSKTKDKKIIDAMTSSLVQSAKESNSIQKKVKRKMEQENSKCTSLLRLNENLHSKAKKARKDHQKLTINSSSDAKTAQTSDSLIEALQLPSNDNENSKANERKLQELINQRTCKVCLDRFYDCMFMPCNHLCCCLQCANALNQCPICGHKVDKIMKVYFR